MKLTGNFLLRIALGVFVLSSGPSAYNQDRRTLATKTADILAQFPARSSDHRDRLAREMLGLGESGIVEIARQLVPAGKGNDTAVRFALNALAVYASETEADRAFAERALIGALASTPDLAAKSFLLSQLGLVGREDTVRAISPLLLDPDLFEAATQVALSIGSPASRRVLVAALGPAKGDNLGTIVKALGELKAEEAVDAILGLARSANPVMRKTALAALAGIASPKSLVTMTAAARMAGYRYDPTNATAALVAYARNLAGKGDLVDSEHVCRAIMKACADPERLAVNAAALGILVEFRGHQMMPDLLRAVDNPDKAYRNAALNFAGQIPDIGAIQQWIAKAQKANPELRAEILNLLGRIGHKAAVPYLRSSLSGAEPGVVLSAAEALAKIERQDSVPDLLPLLASGAGSGRVADILLWLIDERHLDPLVAQMDQYPPEGKASAIRIIAARGGVRFFDKISALTSDPNLIIRQAAFGALKNVARADDRPVILKLMASITDPVLIKDVQGALIVATNQIEPAEARVPPLLEELRSSPRPELILEILPQIGGSEALQVVIERFDQSSGAIKETAFRALVEWKDPVAAAKLLTICPDPKYRAQALDGFLRQTNLSAQPPDQKLLLYRKAMDLAGTPEERRAVLRSMERVRTFQSLMAVSRFLGDPQIGNDAAGVAMRIALPASGAQDGLTGDAVRDVLDKTLRLLSGPESDYEKENIRKYLAAMPADRGFVPIFNGEDLTGWHGLVENPIARAKMAKSELAAKQAEADRKMLTHWSVRDGTVVFNGNGDNLCTDKEYGDFELLVDWRITKDGDSGIYLRGSPQVQIWDPARTDVGAQVGSGGLYNNQKYPSQPLSRVDNPVGEWNSFRIRMVGEKVTVFQNGVKVVDDVVLENYWDRNQPIFRTGAIELQAHGTDLAFRDIYVRELSDSDYGLTDEERAQGFASLFNGRDLDGWIGNKEGYAVEGGVIVYSPASGNRGNLYTQREYADFQFRFDFQLTPGANNGIGIRAPLEGDAAYVGMEIQVLDDPSPVYANLQPYQYHGSVYGVIPARRGFLKPTGEWNSEEIIANGSRVRVILNGTVIVDGDLLEASRNGTVDHQEHPGLRRLSGHIGFLSHDSTVRFRNVRAKDLGGRP
jgi:HEAT repeat protein